MRTTQSFTGVIALLANAPAALGVSVITSSLKSNFSLTTLRPSASPTPTGSFCCDIFPMGVGLNFWANVTATAYTATVITRYIEYNNTVSTELATVTNVNATTGGNIPTDLIGKWNEYGRTSIVAETVASYETTVIASPTPHLAYNRLIYMTGTRGTNTAGISTCIVNEAPTNSVLLPTTYVYVETPPQTRTDSAFLPAAPSDIIQSAVSQIPTLAKEVPFFTECEIVGGTGQPTVHIPVTALTSHSSTTIRRGGSAPVTTDSSANEQPPITTSEVVPAPATTSSKVPGPTGSSATAGVTTTTAQASQNPNPSSTPDASPSRVVVPSLPGSDLPSLGNSQPPVGPSVLPPAPTDIVTPSLPGDAQPPAQSPSSTFVPTDDDLPPTASVTPGNEPQIPFPIVPVPIPTGTKAGSSPASTANPGAVILPGDQTLNPGQQTTISGVVVSVPSNQPTNPAASPSVIVVDGLTTTIVASNAPVVIIDGHTTTAMAAIAPVVVIDGTTRTVPIPAPTPTRAAAVVPITLGSQVVNLQAATASGQAVVLPNSETLGIGATTTYAGKTLVASVVTSGTAVATVVEVLGENQSAAQTVTLPSAAAPTGAASDSETGSASKTLDEEPPAYTGGIASLYHQRSAWMLGSAAGVLLLALA